MPGEMVNCVPFFGWRSTSSSPLAVTNHAYSYPLPAARPNSFRLSAITLPQMWKPYKPHWTIFYRGRGWFLNVLRIL